MVASDAGSVAAVVGTTGFVESSFLLLDPERVVEDDAIGDTEAGESGSSAAALIRASVGAVTRSAGANRGAEVDAVDEELVDDAVAFLAGFGLMLLMVVKIEETGQQTINLLCDDGEEARLSM